MAISRDDTMDPDRLKAAIEAEIATASGPVTTTVTGSASGATLTVSGQVQNAEGDSIAGRFIVGVFFGEAANDGIPFDFGDMAATAGTVIIKEVTADAYCEVLTAATGAWSLTMTIAASDTVHSNAFVVGKVAVTSTVVTVP